MSTFNEISHQAKIFILFYTSNWKSVTILAYYFCGAKKLDILDVPSPPKFTFLSIQFENASD